MTVKDSDFNYEVTKYWNSFQQKEDLMSYANKMKNRIIELLKKTNRKGMENLIEYMEVLLWLNIFYVPIVDMIWSDLNILLIL